MRTRTRSTGYGAAQTQVDVLSIRHRPVDDTAMAAVRTSIITPTLGRESLHRTAASVLRELGPQDEWIVVGDGPRPRAQQIIEAFGDARVHYRESPGTGCWGNAERDMAIAEANGDRLVFLDDDDELADGALVCVRRFHALYADRPAIFRMHLVPLGSVLWNRPEIASGNVGTPMLVAKNIAAMLPRWTDGSAHGYGSDYAFIARCCQMQGAPVFCTDTICNVHHADGPPTLSPAIRAPNRIRLGRGVR